MSKIKNTFKIEGMDCASCAKMIELDLEDAGISAKCSWTKQTLEISNLKDFEKIKEVVKTSGYKLVS